jgi:hypothetical protein
MSGKQGLAAGKMGGAASKFKLAAFGATKAVALDGTLSEFGIDGANGIEGGFQVALI